MPSSQQQQPAALFPHTLSYATPADVPRLAEISTRSFDTDRNSQMKIMGQRPGAFAAGMAQGARGWVSAQHAVMIKATSGSHADDTTPVIVGSVAWGFRGISRDELLEKAGEPTPTPPPPPPPPSEIAAADAGAKEAAEQGGAGDEEIPGAGRIREFEEMTSKHLHDVMDRSMADKQQRWLYIGGISVDPAYHGRGVGSSLLRWGTDLADRVGASCWVHSSEAGWALFSRHGFEEVERLTVDLDEWAVGPPPPGMGVEVDSMRKWGTYTFRYGVRQPVKREE